MPKTAARTISYSDSLKLHGLAALLDQNMAEHQRLKEAVVGIVDEKPDEYGYYGCVDDWAYEIGGRPVGTLLKNLEIEVEPADG